MVLYHLFMGSAHESLRRERAWQLLRWAGVLPVALFFGTAAYYASGIGGMIAATALGTASKSTFAYWVRLGMFYLPKNAAFVFAGAMIAPQYRLTTALGLAAIASSFALMVHVLGQSTVGVTNYTHFAAESAGAACGVICLAVFVNRQRSSIVRRQ